MTKKSLLKYLQSKKLCVLSTCNLKNKPESAVMYFIVGNDYHFYLFTGKNTRKFHNIDDNKKVALVVGGLNNDPSVQIVALAQILNSDESKVASSLIVKTCPEWQDYFSKTTKFLKITPNLAHYSDFSKNIFKEFLF